MFGWEDLLVRCSDSENIVCSLMADSKIKVLGVGEVIDVPRFGELENLWRVTAHACRFVANLKLQKNVMS